MLLNPSNPYNWPSQAERALALRNRLLRPENAEKRDPAEVDDVQAAVDAVRAT